MHYFGTEHLYFTLRFQLSLVGRSVRASFPNQAIALSKIHGSSPARPMGTILPFIMYGCVWIAPYFDD